MLRVSLGFQTLENNKSKRPQAECFHQFSRVWNPAETLAFVFEILLLISSNCTKHIQAGDIKVFCGKYYTYVRKCLGSLPSLRDFIAKIRLVYNIRNSILRGRGINSLLILKKWEKLVPALTPSSKLTLSYPTFSWSPVLFIL